MWMVVIYALISTWRKAGKPVKFLPHQHFYKHWHEYSIVCKFMYMLIFLVLIAFLLSNISTYLYLVKQQEARQA